MKLSYHNASEALPDIMRRVMQLGAEVNSRNGNTRELLMTQIELTQPWPLEITTTGRKVSLPAQIAETMWVLAGRNDVGWLAHYLPRAAEFSDNGETWRGGYGPRIRGFRGLVDSDNHVGTVDQFQHVINLLLEDPKTRRAVINIYDPAVDTEPGKDIPCNNWLHFIARNGRLNLHVATRSNDLMWGWSGINSFEWSALLTIVAGLTNLSAGSINFSISSLHLYEQHWKKADTIAKNSGETRLWPRDNPRFDMPLGMKFDELVEKWFALETLIREGDFTPELAGRVAAFPEPMFRSWLLVLALWWNPGLSSPALRGTSLGYALSVSPGPKVIAKNQVRYATPRAIEKGSDMDRFIRECDELHADKNRAYGDSWMKRGEQMSIMANIARKVDRLGVDGGGDTSLDTAQDLTIYLAKYSAWLKYGSDDHRMTGTSHDREVRDRLRARAECVEPLLELPLEELEGQIKSAFTELEVLVTEHKPRMSQVGELRELTLALAFQLWKKSQAAKAHAVMRGPEVPTEQEFLGNDHAARNATRAFTGYNI